MPYNNSRRPAFGRNSYSRNRRHTGNRRGGGNRGPKKDYIDPKRFVKAAKVQEETAYEAQNTFNDFALHDSLKAAVGRKGFVTPSAIQDQSIPVALSGQDIIGIANTGTGKTAAFSLPLLNKLIKNKDAKAIVLAPTRELAEQILEECKSFSRGSNIYWALLIGGASMNRQINDLRRRPNLIVGTPGRIKDHLVRGNLKLHDFDNVVLDEVDRMLDMGFVGDVREILNQTKSDKQSFFFSATMDKRVRGLVDEFSVSPVTISVKTGDTSDNVEQDVVRYANNNEKLDKLHDVLIVEHPGRKTLVFDDTRRSVENLHKELQQRGFKTGTIHGGKNQSQRKRALAKFKANEFDVLVATDVAARGIDVDGITHVVNYSTPQTYADYTHRIGRAGRAGQKGYALTFVKN